LKLPDQQKKRKEKRSPSPSTSTTSKTKVSRDEEIALAKSRAILEAKAKLYDEIMSNGEMRVLAEDDGDDDNDKSFLVDFERKIFDKNVQPPKIEFTDNFGRTRLVTPDEYERLKSEERKQQTSRDERTSTNDVEQEIQRVERLHREKMRSKWEAEMEELRNKTHVHYQDVLFDEKRDHGVGYYQFSTDDQKRTEQMTMLNDLRSQTKLEQMKFQHDQNQRQSTLSERLQKMRMRKAKEMGIQLGVEEKPIETPATPVIERPSPIETPATPVIERPSPIETPATPVIERTERIETSVKTAEIVRTAPPTTNSNLSYPFPVVRPAKGSDRS